MRGLVTNRMIPGQKRAVGDQSTTLGGAQEAKRSDVAVRTA